MASTSSDIRALCLWEVNFSHARSGEDHVHKHISEDGGGLEDGLIEHGVVITHGGVLSETTHDDLRYAVEPASGGWDRRGMCHVC
jgi:hypothetical protein